MLTFAFITKEDSLAPFLVPVVSSAIGFFSRCSISAFWRAVLSAIISNLFCKINIAPSATKRDGRLSDLAALVVARFRAVFINVAPNSFKARSAFRARRKLTIFTKRLSWGRENELETARFTIFSFGKRLPFNHVLIIPPCACIFQRYKDAFGIEPELISD